MLTSPYKWSGQNCYIARQIKGGLDQFVICRFSESTKKLEKTGIQLVGKCVDLIVDDGNKLTICVKNKDQFVMHQFQLGLPEKLFNLSLLAVRRHSFFYTSRERERLIEKLPEKLQTFRFDF
ncbi:hypothetical protein M3Y97_01058200 [Aphelenchoides bicaudatus]|nr:hypothetical protein M3Y97_01058200 [Aphelenchoides bicaudatus]